MVGGNDEGLDAGRLDGSACSPGFRRLVGRMCFFGSSRVQSFAGRTCEEVSCIPGDYQRWRLSGFKSKVSAITISPLSTKTLSSVAGSCELYGLGDRNRIC